MIINMGWKKVSVVTLLTVMITRVSMEIFTSSARVEHLINHEENVLSALKTYIHNQKMRLETLSKFRENRIRFLKSNNSSQINDGVRHPNSFYLAIKGIVREYTNGLNEHFVPFTVSLPEILNGYSLADTDDLVGAKQALLRLQSVYKLRALDMAMGKYLGFEGRPLDLLDVYEIAQLAFSDGKIDACIEWLEAAAKISMKKMLDGEDTTVPNLGTILALQGRAHVFNGDIKAAQALYKKSIVLDHENYEVKTLGDELLSQPRLEKPIEKDYFQNFSRLCSMDGKINTPLSHLPRIVCRYKAGLLPYDVFKEEILSESPFASVIYDVITDKENEFIRSHVKSQLARGRVGDGDRVVSNIRTSDTAWAYDQEHPLVKAVSLRVQHATGLSTKQRDPLISPSSGEAFQVVNYGLGGHYEVHLDPLVNPEAVAGVPYLKGAGTRVATFLIYLTDVEKGGNTVFTKADISVAPVKNMALFWYNYPPARHESEPDDLTHHAGCPVLVGQKWVTNKWIWMYGNTFRRRCGLKPEDTQLDIEPDMREHYGAYHDV